MARMSANYDNPEYNRLFDKMQNMDNSPERLQIIRQMKSILQRDAPWVFAYHRVNFQSLSRMDEKWETKYHWL